MGTGTQFKVERKFWLYAYQFEQGLIVYRSLAVRDTDKMFSQVLDCIRLNSYQLRHRSTQKDKDLVFGQGEISLWM